MKNKTILRFSLMIIALIIICNIGTFAQTTECSKMSDTDVVLAVYKKIKAKYPAAIININVTFKDGTVKLDGWATSEKAIKKIEEMAKKVKCIKMVDNELDVGKPGGCAPGQKECGGTCIGEKEPCNICLLESSAPGCLGLKQ